MVLDKTFKAKVAMANKYVAVKLTSTEGEVDLATTTNKAIGILQSVGVAGESVRVRLFGESFLKANAAFSIGDYLTGIAATGKLDTAVDGTDYPIAIAIEAATAQDDEVKGFVNFAMALTKDLS